LLPFNAMTEQDYLAAARRELEGGAELRRVLSLLQDQEAHVSREVRNDVPLSRRAARAAENLDLAVLCLDRRDDAQARFHLDRALTLLQSLDQDIAHQTRATDQAENRRHFMSG